MGAPLLVMLSAAGAFGQEPTVSNQVSGTTVLLQAVSVVDTHVVWVSGHGGTYVRTVDGGRHWTVGRVRGADTLQFRDVHAVDASTAYLLSAGTGDLSRIYKTTDGGASWDLLFRNTAPTAFYDCFDFWDPHRGIAYSDAVDGQLVILRTNDGKTWHRLPADHVPAAAGSEGGFAASGTCVVTHGARHAWIGTGAGDTARMIRTGDAGLTWTAAPVPMVSGSNVSGVFTVAFRDLMHGAALGGDLQRAEDFTQNVIVTDNGGRTWRPVGRPTFPGAVYGATYVPNSVPPILVAVGPAGAAYSVDDGEIWRSLSDANHWGLGFAGSRAGWLVGPNGQITHVRFGGGS
jgi:photosystem II stability/assembly factor-like uncharacterized protein